MQTAPWMPFGPDTCVARRFFFRSEVADRNHLLDRAPLMQVNQSSSYWLYFLDHTGDAGAALSF
jgi:hypothetical protein